MKTPTRSAAAARVPRLPPHPGKSPWRWVPGSAPLAIALLILLTSAAHTAIHAGDWPQWRGPRRDGHVGPGDSFPSRLPSSLEPRWHVPAGSGFASPIVSGSRLFLADEQDQRETARCLDATTGRELWRTPYAKTAGDEWGTGPRCTPVADDRRLYVQSLKGEFACLDQTDGHRLWGFSFEKDFQVEFVGGNDAYDAAARRRGNSGSPILLDDRLYVPVGSTNGATVVCLDKVTGREHWRAGTDETAYAALMTGTLAGRDHLVAYTAFSLLGLDATRGEVLWRVPLKSHANRHAVTPVIAGNDILLSSHTLGLRAFTVSATSQGPDAGLVCQPRWSAPRLKTSLATLVLVDGFLYGQGPEKNYQCVDPATGEVRWSQPGFGEQLLVAYASTLAAGKRLLVATESGLLLLLEARPDRYSELGRHQVSGKSWSHPAFANGRLYLRDRRELYAFDLPPDPAP